MWHRSRNECPRLILFMRVYRPRPHETISSTARVDASRPRILFLKVAPTFSLDRAFFCYKTPDVLLQNPRCFCLGLPMYFHRPHILLPMMPTLAPKGLHKRSQGYSEAIPLEQGVSHNSADGSSATYKSAYKSGEATRRSCKREKSSLLQTTPEGLKRDSRGCKPSAFSRKQRIAREANLAVGHPRLLVLSPLWWLSLTT